MKKLILGLFIFGLTTQFSAQTIELPETLITVNYKYLDAIDIDNVPERVKKLEDEVKELKDDLYKKKQDDKKNIYFGITIVSYLVLSYFVGNIWSGWHLLLILGLSLMWNS